MIQGNGTVRMIQAVGRSFGWTDYTFFCLVLLVSLLIGVYFGFFSRQDTAAEYLLGGRRMGCVPVATSLIASHVSGITLLGVPSEVYRYGSQYTACIVTSILTCLITTYVFLPVFYGLQLTSTFEYLEIRFARPVRTLCSVLFVLSLFMYIPIVVYVPALAFSQVTDFGVHTITPVLCLVCILYTTVGGLKAVVWTDTVQFCVTVGALFAVLGLGISSVGGVNEVWRISGEGHRLIFFNMDPSPFARNTFWGMSVGMTITWLGHLGVHQGTVQRFLSLPKEKNARHAMAITGVGLIVVKLVSVFTGLIMYARYHDCDPLLTKSIERSDQTLPHYVMDVAGNVPGLPGLFLAGLVSAALATMSASLNTMSGIVYEDFLSPWIPDGPSKDGRAANVMKIIVLVAGFISVGLVFVIEHLGTVFEMALSIRGVTDGPSLGLFVLGMLVPWSNTKGAMIGGCAGLLGMFALVAGNKYYSVNGWIKDEPLPTSAAGCLDRFNLTDPRIEGIVGEGDGHSLFEISFIYYTGIGCLIAVVFGSIGSLLGETDLARVDPGLITPFMRRFLPKRYTEVTLNPLNGSTIKVNKRKECESN